MSDIELSNGGISETAMAVEDQGKIQENVKTQ